MRLSRIVFSLGCFLALGSGLAFGDSLCSTTACGTIQCAGGCYQQEQNGQCVANYCTDARAVTPVVDLRPTSPFLDCAPNNVSGSNAVSGCGNTVSGVGNTVLGDNNVVSGTNNYVEGSCLVVSGSDGYYTGNNCN